MAVGHPLFFVATTVERRGWRRRWWRPGGKAPLWVAPPEARERLVFAYTDFGKPGKVGKDARIADIDTRTLIFDNNVRLNIKRTDFSKNAVQVSLRVGQGLIDLPERRWAGAADAAFRAVG
jgi:hypothetical protein